MSNQLYHNYSHKTRTCLREFKLPFYLNYILTGLILHKINQCSEVRNQEYKLFYSYNQVAS